MSSQAKQSEAYGGNRNAAIEQEGMGTHWQLLDQWTRTRYREISEGDNFAHRVVARHKHQLPNMPPMEEQEVIIYLIRCFLDQTNGHASVEDAAVYLARSSWDVRVASYRWIDPDDYAAIEKDEIWGDEENDASIPGKLPISHETIRPIVQKSITRPSVERNASPIDERRHNMPRNEASHYSSFASSTRGTIGSKQQDGSFAGSKEGHNGSYGESRAETYASKDSVSIASTVARGFGHDEYGKTGGTSRQKPGLMYRPSPGKDADGDGKAGDCDSPTSDQNIPSSPQRKIRPPAGVKTTNSTATARKPNVEGSSEPTYYTKVAALNPDMDRSPAVHGEPMPEKMKVQYELPHTKNIKRLYFRQYNNGRSFDWNNIEHIRVLNRWRAQVFRRMFGSTRNGGSSFHEEENQWLTERYLRHQETALRHGAEPDYHTMNWVVITKAFNQHFEGRILPGCDEPRRYRTKGSITTQRYRIEAISKMTGTPLKAKLKEQELAEATDGDETEDEDV